MKIIEIIQENEIDEGIKLYPFDVAKKKAAEIGFQFHSRPGSGGTHEKWIHPETKETWMLSRKGKDASPASSSDLAKLIRKYRSADQISEAVGLPADSSTLLSLLSEMANLLGAGGTQNDVGPLRSAIVQAFNNGSAEDSARFEKQLNFRLGSIRSMWMAKNWPQLKSCFLRLKKNPKYQRSIKALDVLGEWPVFLIKDPKEKAPTLSKYFSAILSSSPTILQDMSRLEPERHVQERAAHLAKLLPQRMSEFSAFKNYWIDRYEKETAQPSSPSQPKDNLSGQQAAGAEDIISKVLGAIPPKLASEIRPQIARMGSQNEKLMFIMKALQKAGIDPNKVLG